MKETNVSWGAEDLVKWKVADVYNYNPWDNIIGYLRVWVSSWVSMTKDNLCPQMYKREKETLRVV